MPKNTVHGGGSYAEHPELVSLNPDAQRAIAEGRLPDREKSAFVGREVTEDEYNDAMERHGTDEFTAEDKHVVRNWHAQRGTDDEAVDRITGDDADDATRNGPNDTPSGAVDGPDRGVGPDATGNEKEGQPSPGTTSSPSSKKPETSGSGTRPDLQSPARTTASPSSGGQTASTTARPTDGSGKENQ